MLFRSLKPEHRATKFAGRAEEYCPTCNMVRTDAPVLIFHGDADQTVDPADVIAFTEAMAAEGNRCELVMYPGEGHSFFHLDRKEGTIFVDTMRRCDALFTELGWIEPISKLHKT